ncbi:pyridoxal phosphate-dependent class II aminotransferase [Litoreibacter sp.]|nr:pyridoxal phosphate-dependent class II aminotransferase [Litoreibacter sp.]
MTDTRDHGGGLDAAILQYGGARGDWLDLSTGINPVPYPIGEISHDAWTALPDQGAFDRLTGAARRFWNVPDSAQIVPAPGASALIARMPELTDFTGAYIPGPTYNEHAAAFAAAHKLHDPEDADAPTHIYVHPNNPTGRLWPAEAIGKASLTIIDESFCDVTPAASHVGFAADPGVVVLKSFGKFWGLAGLRLGFAIAAPRTLAPVDMIDVGIGDPEMVPRASLTDMLGPWAVSGPGLDIAARALNDVAWAEATRARLAQDADRMDQLMTRAGASVVGGTSLFRLYDVGDAAAWQDRLAKGHIWSRIFPYSDSWLRLGLPAPNRWAQLEAVLA